MSLVKGLDILSSYRRKHLYTSFPQWYKLDRNIRNMVLDMATKESRETVYALRSTSKKMYKLMWSTVSIDRWIVNLYKHSKRGYFMGRIRLWANAVKYYPLWIRSITSQYHLYNMTANDKNASVQLLVKYLIRAMCIEPCILSEPNIKSSIAVLCKSSIFVNLMVANHEKMAHLFAKEYSDFGAAIPIDACFKLGIWSSKLFKSSPIVKSYLEAHPVTQEQWVRILRVANKPLINRLLNVYADYEDKSQYETLVHFTPVSPSAMKKRKVE